jgi:dCMP deaminase
LLDFKTGEALHLCPSAHAEANAIVSAARLGHAIEGATMYVTCGTPCKDCLGLIINAGLIEVVCTSTDAYDELSNLLVLQANLRITTYL